MSEISLIIEAPVARIRLDRPERRNAMTRAMWLALPGLCAEIADNENVLVVVVEGAGGHFCAGADIGEFATVYCDAAAARETNDAIQAGLAAIAALDSPTIAAVRGNALGGGLALALCCDLRFCADDAHLALPPAKLGALYGFIETRRLVETVGPARAKDLLFSARRVACAEALAIGLVDRLVPAANLDQAVADYAAELAGLSQLSIRGAKIAVQAIAAGLEKETRSFRKMVERAALSEDFAEGQAAFLTKRKPVFRFRGRLDPSA
jgi:enoyl-CoA hydratase/carnithine racemase